MMFHFSIVEVHLFFVNCISLYFFDVLQNTTICCLLFLNFDLVGIGPQDFSFFVPALLLFILKPLSYLLHLFIYH